MYLFLLQLDIVLSNDCKIKHRFTNFSDIMLHLLIQINHIKF